MSTRVIDVPELRERIRVFRDRDHAGRVLSEMLGGRLRDEAIVLAIPAGGVPVAASIGECLGLPVDVAVVSKITFPWNSEAGYGAVAFDGTLRLNEALLEGMPLGKREIAAGIEQTRRKVDRRTASLRQGLPPLDVGGRNLIVVDDGLASGFTMRVAIEALERGGPASVAVAVPTGHADAMTRFSQSVDVIYCANVRSGWRFAVADAYEHWSDVDEERITCQLKGRHSSPERPVSSG